jgi:putative ABC transport system substrate-binding protein
MRRREFIAGLGFAAVWSVPARSQPTKVWRVGFLSPGLPPDKNPVDAVFFEAFRQQMQELGYVEGKNLAVAACAVNRRAFGVDRKS